jgi:hypothetical protein
MSEDKRAELESIETLASVSTATRAGLAVALMLGSKSSLKDKLAAIYRSGSLNRAEEMRAMIKAHMPAAHQHHADAFNMQALLGLWRVIESGGSSFTAAAIALSDYSDGQCPTADQTVDLLAGMIR